MAWSGSGMRVPRGPIGFLAGLVGGLEGSMPGILAEQKRRREAAEKNAKTPAPAVEPDDEIEEWQRERTKAQQDELREPLTPEYFQNQLPRLEPRWRSRQPVSGVPPLSGNAGPAVRGGSRLRLARLLAADAEQDGTQRAEPDGGLGSTAPGLGRGAPVPRAGSPGVRASRGAGNGGAAAQERVRKLVATWEELHGQTATAAVRSQIEQYVRTA